MFSGFRLNTGNFKFVFDVNYIPMLYFFAAFLKLTFSKGLHYRQLMNRVYEFFKLYVFTKRSLMSRMNGDRKL